MIRVTPIDRQLNDFATRCFRDTADGDYIAARMSFRARLIQQFLWSSLQALEKYLKCILLLNRIPCIKPTHDLARLLAAIRGAGKFDLRLCDRTKRFIEYLDTYGRHRYFESPYHTLGDEIVSLDCAVWDIRRYAQSIDYVTQLPWGDIDNPPIELARIERARDEPWHKFAIAGGKIENIIADRQHPARKQLLWQNPFFGTRNRKTIMLARHLDAANAPLSMRPELLDEVLKYVFLPGDVKAAYREELERARRGRAAGVKPRGTSARHGASSGGS